MKKLLLFLLLPVFGICKSQNLPPNQLASTTKALTLKKSPDSKSEDKCKIGKGASVLIVENTDSTYYKVKSQWCEGYIEKAFIVADDEVYTPSGSSSKTIQTGKRGGKYYINSNGKKTYVKH